MNIKPEPSTLTKLLWLLRYWLPGALLSCSVNPAFTSLPWLSLIFFYCNYFVVIVLAEEDVSFSSPESNAFLISFLILAWFWSV